MVLGAHMAVSRLHLAFEWAWEASDGAYRVIFQPYVIGPGRRSDRGDYIFRYDQST